MVMQWNAAIWEWRSKARNAHPNFGPTEKIHFVLSLHPTPSFSHPTTFPSFSFLSSPQFPPLPSIKLFCLLSCSCHPLPSFYPPTIFTPFTTTFTPPSFHLHVSSTFTPMSPPHFPAPPKLLLPAPSISLCTIMHHCTTLHCTTLHYTTLHYCSVE